MLVGAPKDGERSAKSEKPVWSLMVQAERIEIATSKALLMTNNQSHGHRGLLSF
jgi:hypothetical protein